MNREPDERWLRGLLGPDEPEMSCEQCFSTLDRYVELEHAAADADDSFPGMKEHLEGCPACREEHDLLLALLDES